MKERSPRFSQAVEMMRSKNAKTAEDGFHSLIDIARDHGSDLLREFRAERDPAMRAWIVELLGIGKCVEAFHMFVELLDGPEEALRSWAVTGLERLDTKEARTVLWQRGVKKGGKHDGA